MSTPAISFAGLYFVLKQNLSNRAATFVAQQLLDLNGISEGKVRKKAAEHTSEHGSKGSDKAAAALLKLQRYSRPQLEEWLRLATDFVNARSDAWAAQYKADTAKAALAGWTEQPLTAAESDARARAALETWWQEEGRHECELEETGQSKSYYYERDRAERHGGSITPREYLAGKTAEEAQDEAHA